MKNKVHYMTFMFLIVMFLLSACFDDKGNYDYSEIKDVVIDMPGVAENDGVVSCDRYSDLALTPDIKFDDGTTAEDYTFEWSVYLQQPKENEDDKYDAKKVIGTSQNLAYHVEEAPGDYYLLLRVTHKDTKAVTDYKMELIINTVKGWLVYDENAAGEGDLQIIRDGEIIPGLAATQSGVVSNYFSASNNGKKLQGGKFLAWRNMNNRYDHIFVYKEDGVSKLSGTTYELVSEDFSEMFFTAPSVVAPMFHYYPNPSYGNLEFLCNNNEVYLIRWNMMGQVDKFASPLSVFGTPSKFSPFIAPIPVASGNTNRAVLYEPAYNGRFSPISSGGAKGSASTTGAFNGMNINQGGEFKMNLVEMAQGRDGMTCAIFKDELDADHPWLYVADFRVASTPLAIGKYDMSAVEGFAEAEFFAFGTRGDVMFYATPDQVYSYPFGGTATKLPQLTGKVVAMKLYTHSSNEDYNGRMLFVATWDGGEGRVYKIKFNELNGQVEGEVEEFEGFGKVVDMIIKE